MRQIRGHQGMFLFVMVTLVAGCYAPELHAAGAKKPAIKPGVDTNFKWSQTGFNEARKIGKPIFLYVYDPMNGKPSNSLKTVQEDILPNSGVKDALKEFHAVMQPMASTSWPPFYTQPSKNGVALYIMTCDGRTVATFTSQNLPKPTKDGSGTVQYPLLVAAAAAAVQANPKVAENLKKNPPKDYLSPQELAAQREAGVQPAGPEPEQPKGNAAAGLLDGPPAAGTKTADGGTKKDPLPSEKPPAKTPVDEVE